MLRAQTAAGSSSSQFQPHISVRETRAVSASEHRTHPSAFPMSDSSSRPQTPTNNPHHRRHATGHDSSSDDDVRIVSSRCSVTSRKDPVSDLTKHEMRQLAKEEDEERLRVKAEANKGKGNETKNGEPRTKVSIGGRLGIQGRHVRALILTCGRSRRRRGGVSGDRKRDPRLHPRWTRQTTWWRRTSHGHMR